MNFIARVLTEIIQAGAFLLTLLGGFATYRAYQTLQRPLTDGGAAAANGVPPPPQIFGVHSVIFLGAVTLIALAFFLLASTCRAILETARNTGRLVDKMGA